MKIKEAYSIARKNIKSRTKIGSTLFTILFFAMFVFVLLNSMVHSINNYIDFNKETPSSRHLVYETDSKNADLYQDLINTCKDLEHVIGVNPYIQHEYVDVEGIIDNTKLNMTVFSYSENYADYLIKGSLPKENEALLPHYLYSSHSNSYRDLSKYIGKELTLYIEDKNDEIHTYKCKVSGTYDNVFSSTGAFSMLINADDAVTISELAHIGIEDKLQNQMEASGNYDPSTYFGYEHKYYYAVCVDEYKNIEDVKDTIYDKLGVSTPKNLFIDDNEVAKTYSYIYYIILLIIIIILVAITIRMVILFGKDISGRNKEISTYLVKGYTKNDLIQIFSFEYITRLVPVYVFSVICALIMLKLENMGIKNWFSLEFKPLHMDLSPLALILSLIIMIIIAGTSIWQISRKLTIISK